MVPDSNRGEEDRCSGPVVPEKRLCGIKWNDFLTNEEVRRRTDQMPLTSIMRRRHLGLFGHVARSDPANDTRRALAPLHHSGKDLPGCHGTLGYLLSQRT